MWSLGKTSFALLTVHFRFEFNTLFGGKINKIVQYPEYLNMRPFVSDKEVRLLHMYIQ